MRGLRLLFVVGLATGIIGEKFFVSSQSSSPTADDLYLEGKTSGEFPVDDEDGDDDGSGSGSGDYALTDLMNQHVDRTTLSNKMVPDPSQSATVSPHITATTAADIQHPPTTAEDTFPNANSKNEEARSIEPTADNWITHKTSLSSTTSHPTEITTLNRVVSVTKETNEDNSLDRWDVPTPKTSGDEVVISEIDDNEILAKDGRGSRLHELSPEEVTSENLWERTEVLAAVIACGVVGFLCAVFLLLLLAYRMKKKDEGSYDLGDTKLSNTQYQKAPTKEFYA